MRRLRVIAAVLILVAAACGGDSGDGGAGDSPDQATTTQASEAPPDADEVTTTAAAAAPTDNGNSDDSEGSGPSTARVTLGDQSYNFSTEGAIVAQCLTDLFGVFSVQLPMIDESGAPAEGGLQLIILREGTDPDVVGQTNAIRVAVGDEDWVGDEADDMYEQSEILEPGMGQVDSAEVDGRTVRGTATFFRLNSLFTDQVETITGSFEATCGEERNS